MFGRKNNGHLALAAKRLEKMEKSLMALGRFGKSAPATGQAKKLIAELNRRRIDFQTTTRHMKSHVRAAEARMKKLNVASTASWSAFQTALVKSQKAFARANRKAGKALRRAAK